MRLVLGYDLAANELIWWIFRYSHEGIHLTNLPLQLCDVTLWVTILACLTAAPLAIEVAYFAGMAGSGMALLTPDLWSPWPSYPAVYFFLARGGVATASAVLVFGRIQPLRTGAWWRSHTLLTAYTMVLGAFNGVVGANSMYLCRKPLLGSWPIYLAGAAGVGFVLFWLLWLPVRLRAPTSRQAGS